MVIPNNKDEFHQWIEARQAMERLTETSRQWCCAFDARDVKAVGLASQRFRTAALDFIAANKKH